MSSSRRTTHQANLATGKTYSIDLIVENNYTHFIRVSQLSSKKVLAIIPFDPTDRTIAGSINKDALSVLGDDTENALKTLSETLLTQLGAKQFILIPKDCTLPNYSTPEKSGFDRLYQSDTQQLREQTSAILNEHKNLTAELDKNFTFVTDEKSLTKGRSVQERYQEISDILEKTRFTTDKMSEYKNEELQGKLSRFKNDHIRPIVMLDKKGNIAGLVRATLMGNNVTYLSDEVVNQAILPLDKFEGDSEKAQAKKRDIFLLAYLMNNACKFGLSDQHHLLIIAAKDREDIYAHTGYKKFPLDLDGYNVMMKLGSPGSALIKAQDRIKSLPLSTMTECITASESKPSYDHYFQYIKQTRSTLFCSPDKLNKEDEQSHSENTNYNKPQS